MLPRVDFRVLGWTLSPHLGQLLEVQVVLSRTHRYSVYRYFRSFVRLTHDLRAERAAALAHGFVAVNAPTTTTTCDSHHPHSSTTASPSPATVSRLPVTATSVSTAPPASRRPPTAPAPPTSVASHSRSRRAPRHTRMASIHEERQSEGKEGGDSRKSHRTSGTSRTGDQKHTKQRNAVVRFLKRLTRRQKLVRLPSALRFFELDRRARPRSRTQDSPLSSGIAAAAGNEARGRAHSATSDLAGLAADGDFSDDESDGDALDLDADSCYDCRSEASASVVLRDMATPMPAPAAALDGDTSHAEAESKPVCDVDSHDNGGVTGPGSPAMKSPLTATATRGAQVTPQRAATPPSSQPQSQLHKQEDDSHQHQGQQQARPPPSPPSLPPGPAPYTGPPSPALPTTGRDGGGSNNTNPAARRHQWMTSTTACVKAVASSGGAGVGDGVVQKHMRPGVEGKAGGRNDNSINKCDGDGTTGFGHGVDSRVLPPPLHLRASSASTLETSPTTETPLTVSVSPPSHPPLPSPDPFNPFGDPAQSPNYQPGQSWQQVSLSTPPSTTTHIRTTPSTQRSPARPSSRSTSPPVPSSAVRLPSQLQRGGASAGAGAAARVPGGDAAAPPSSADLSVAIDSPHTSGDFVMVSDMEDGTASQLSTRSQTSTHSAGSWIVLATTM